MRAESWLRIHSAGPYQMDAEAPRRRVIGAGMREVIEDFLGGVFEGFSRGGL